MERKYAEVKDGIIRKNSIWDKLLFHKVQVMHFPDADEGMFSAEDYTKGPLWPSLAPSRHHPSNQLRLCTRQQPSVNEFVDTMVFPNAFVFRTLWGAG